MGSTVLSLSTRSSSGKVYNAPPSGPISLADVRQALADTDPSDTNAGTLRKIMGRGSYATIQKHLDAIRQERAPVVPVAPGTTPAPPADGLETTLESLSLVLSPTDN